MNANERKEHWLSLFRSGTTTIEIKKTEFEQCFPDYESLFAFLKINRLHLHVNSVEWGDVFAISVDDDKNI